MERGNMAVPLESLCQLRDISPGGPTYTSGTWYLLTAIFMLLAELHPT